jgi:hypothetical protein
MMQGNVGFLGGGMRGKFGIRNSECRRGVALGLIEIWCPRVGGGGFGMASVQPGRLRYKADRRLVAHASRVHVQPGSGYAVTGRLRYKAGGLRCW